MKNAILCCAGCGEEYGADAWRGLPWVCTLSRADVHRHVIDWPKRRVVEVRLCQSCGQSMARTASAARAEEEPPHRERHLEPRERISRTNGDRGR